MKLFEVEMTTSVMVLAESPSDAERVAESLTSTICDNESGNFVYFSSTTPVKKIGPSHPWYGAIPYSKRDSNPNDSTCECFVDNN